MTNEANLPASSETAGQALSCLLPRKLGQDGDQRKRNDKNWLGRILRILRGSVASNKTSKM